MAKPTTGYINGSDILLKVGEKAIGHCTTHTLTFNSETKDRNVKPAASQGYSAGLWKGKGVTGLSISLSAEGLRYYGEAENGFTELSALWGAGASSSSPASRRHRPPRTTPPTAFSWRTTENRPPIPEKHLSNGTGDRSQR